MGLAEIYLNFETKFGESGLLKSPSVIVTCSYPAVVFCVLISVGFDFFIRFFGIITTGFSLAVTKVYIKYLKLLRSYF